MFYSKSYPSNVSIKFYFISVIILGITCVTIGAPIARLRRQAESEITTVPAADTSQSEFEAEVIVASNDNNDNVQLQSSSGEIEKPVEGTLPDVDGKTAAVFNQEKTSDSLDQLNSQSQPNSQQAISTQGQLETLHTLLQASNAVGNTFHQYVGNMSTNLRQQILNGRQSLLRMIGTVDRGVDQFGKGLQKQVFQLTLEGQKAAARIYDRTPQWVNRFIQRIGTRFGGGGNSLPNKLNQVFTNFRDTRKKFYDAWDDHELDVHNVVQNRFQDINKSLRVQPLPKYEFGWL